MRFDTSQILDLAGISKEMLRHWKRALPPLFGRDGRSDRYSYAELVALCAIAQAVTKLTIPVSRFTDNAVWLFEEIERQLKPGGALLILCILPDRLTFLTERELANVEAGSFIRLDVVVDRLSTRAFSEEEQPQEAQLDLPFRDAKIMGIRITRRS